MEHVVTADFAGVVDEVTVEVGVTVVSGDPLVTIAPSSLSSTVVDADVISAVDPTTVRADLAAVVDRHERTHDVRRPDAVARRHDAGRRTARENVEDLVDEGTFVEYGPLVVAAQRRRRSLEELIDRTPADGVVGGVGTVHDEPVVVMSYDYTVLAGTQGLLGHEKKDRLFEIAERRRLPVVFFTEGGGGRPGDTDGIGISGLDCLAFNYFAQLSGLVPLVGIAAGYCFAGNAAILGCCDVVIGVAGTNIAMGGPAMIEGGGLGVYEPTEIGPFETQVANGVIDIAVDDDASAVAAAKQYLSYFGAEPDEWSCGDQRRLRHLVPENRSRVYDVRAVIDALCDDGSVLELRGGWAPGMVTALARVEGRRVGDRGQRSCVPRRRDRRRWCRQGGPVPAAVRRVRPARGVPVRHARVHGRARARSARGGPPRQPDVRHRRQPDRAVRDDRPPQGLRPRRAGHGRRIVEGAVVLRLVAHRGVRRHEHRGCGAARPRPGVGGDRRPRRTRAEVPVVGEASVRERRGGERRHAVRDRRRHRPRRVTHLDHDPADRRRRHPSARERSDRTSTPGDSSLTASRDTRLAAARSWRATRSLRSFVPARVGDAPSW